LSQYRERNSSTDTGARSVDSHADLESLRGFMSYTPRSMLSRASDSRESTFVSRPPKT